MTSSIPTHVQKPGKVGQSARPLTFPRDEGRHPGVECEWWYFKGHAQADDGSHYSFVVCYFAPATNLIANYFLGVIDEDKGICYSAVAKSQERKCRCSEHGLDLSYGSNWWRQGDKVFTYEMHNEVPGDIPISLDLRMRSLKAPLLPCGTEMIKIAGGYSYYYAQTHLNINGCLAIRNETKHVRGVGWIERQWGSWEWGLFGGWEWFGINLNRNTEIFLFLRLHPVTRRYVRPWLFNIIVEDSTASLSRFKLHHLDYWRSKNGFLYPSGWKIIAPERRIKLTLKPLLKDQEMYGGLWEGVCTARGTLDGRRVSGRAFVECAYVPTPAPYYVAIRFLSRLRMLSPIRSLLGKIKS